MDGYLIMKRESGIIELSDGSTVQVNNVWVVRYANGGYVDHRKWRNDLLAEYGEIKIIGE